MRPLMKMFPARSGSAALTPRHAPPLPEPPITNPLPDDDSRIGLEDGARRRSKETPA